MIPPVRRFNSGRIPEGMPEPKECFSNFNSATPPGWAPRGARDRGYRFRSTPGYRSLNPAGSRRVEK